MKKSIWSITIVLLLTTTLFSQNAKPVTPNASPEAQALLELLYSASGKHMLTGQHNFPISRAKNSEFAAEYIGKTPAVWSQDFGFAKEGDKDSYLSRPSIVDEAIKQHKMGSIITLCWHGVPPTAEEPITFTPQSGVDPEMVASVQGKLQDQQFKDILTPGTALHTKWMAQVDEIAKYLKQLQDAKVPVLWRPYHEMNGDWFWWGGIHKGKYTTERLYRQIFDRLVHHHKLNNLVWVWSVDRTSGLPTRAYKKYYPGNEYLDVVALDVYGSDYKQTYYDQLKELANGKPMALAEVGIPPSLEVLKTQPNWAFYVIWSGMARRTSKEQYNEYIADKRILFMEDDAYSKLMKPYRESINLPEFGTKEAADFSGIWVLNPYESKGSVGNASHKLNIIQAEDMLAMESFSKVEWSDDEVKREILKTDGSEMVTTVFNTPRIQTTTWSEAKDVLTLDAKATFNFNGNERKITSNQKWSLSNKGKKLTIEEKANGFGGKTESVLIYEKQ